MAEMSFRQIRRIIRRRWTVFIATFFAVLVLSLTVVYLLPPIYVSTSTILIESQQIPEEYVRATVRSYVEERLQAITQQIISRPNLIRIINEFNLYADMRKKYATEVVIDRMRKDISLDTISSADIRGRGSSSAKTVAFKLSYEGGNPGTVQKVSNVLASLYLEENLKSREEQAARTTAFLEKELSQIRAQINDYESRISQFKTDHAGELPENMDANRRAAEDLKRSLEQISMQLLSLKERRIYLEGQLASIDPVSPVMAEEGKSSPAERLLFLRMQLINMETGLSEKHPDVIRLKNEIAELESQLGESSPAVKKQRAYADLQRHLKAVKEKEGELHPDVIRLTREGEALKKEIETLSREGKPLRDASQKPTNPAYISLKAQIDAIDIESKGLLSQRGKIEEELALYRRRIENGPLIEKAYNDLTMDYGHIREQYNQIKSKQLEANVAREMEATQHGERFTIIEPASKPEAPSKPDRMKLALMSLFLSLAGAAGLVFLLENLDHSIKSEKEILETTGLPVFVTIPFLETSEEITKRKRTWIYAVFVVLSAMAVGIVAIHFFWMPLEILWIKVQGRLFTQFMNVVNY
jgi:uncharacterized protein involved in exopolysaccharide biosynthesis